MGIGLQGALLLVCRQGCRPLWCWFVAMLFGVALASAMFVAANAVVMDIFLA